MSDNHVMLTLDEVYDLSRKVLIHNGMSSEHATSIAKVITQGQRDECQSHGIYRLLVCVNTLRNGKVDPQALPTVKDVAPGIVTVDSRFGYSLLGFDTGLPTLIHKAKTNGIAAMAINNCFHFSALWPEVEAIAERGLVGIAMSPSHSWVAPAGGNKPVFGTNPLAFAWPRPYGNPFVFDFATSAVARGDLELHARTNQPIPPEWAVDASGSPTTDPKEALKGAMRTFGGYKGSALSAMIELLAGSLIGDLTSAQSQAFDGGVGATPCHGELVIALDPKVFLGDAYQRGLDSAEQMFNLITEQGARLPSQRRFDARARSQANGVQVPAALFEDILRLLD
ncbi:Ldh family oxidoreductase [Pseudomonas fulva]|uniref:Ldh family oxidoreductase n=1 Tax=Pseudomonas fulva TaxID=47880 RepID=UPI00201DC370|nr:Ldh family oxidoreductase [Pseudomonas fulva]UQY33023.1 Ldh family oxidoreductase [Pseudomonas fulva]